MNINVIYPKEKLRMLRLIQVFLILLMLPVILMLFISENQTTDNQTTDKIGIVIGFVLIFSTTTLWWIKLTYRNVCYIEINEKEILLNAKNKIYTYGINDIKIHYYNDFYGINIIFFVPKNKIGSGFFHKIVIRAWAITAYMDNENKCKLEKYLSNYEVKFQKTSIFGPL